MAEKIYVKGFRTFPKGKNAPDFVLGELVITPREFVDWLSENPDLLTEYKDKKQLRVQILQGKESINFQVNTFKPEAKDEKQSFTPKKVDEDLPF